MDLNSGMIAMKPIVAVVGPTAVGKSRIAIRLAQALSTDVLTADSRQVYRGMDIGTDKPTLAERQGVPHRLIDLVAPDEPFNAGTYRRLAQAEIERLYKSGRIPLIVGGTGLYIRTLLRGLWDGPSADWVFRARLVGEARIEGPGSLHRRLTRVDPCLAERLHPNDEVKIIRGLEVYHLLGQPLSEVHERHAFQERPFSPLLIGITRERPSLYRLIEQRVGIELEKGLVSETRMLLAQGYGRELASMKGLGYRQIAGYLAGEHDYEEAIRRLKRDTRHFAKRQMTWFRQEPSLMWISVTDEEPPERVTERILQVIDAHLLRMKTMSDASVRGRASSSARSTVI